MQFLFKEKEKQRRPQNEFCAVLFSYSRSCGFFFWLILCFRLHNPYGITLADFYSSMIFPSLCSRLILFISIIAHSYNAVSLRVSARVCLIQVSLFIKLHLRYQTFWRAFRIICGKNSESFLRIAKIVLKIVLFIPSTPQSLQSMQSISV